MPHDHDYKIILKHKLRNYIGNLYKYLGDKYCFTSGAFVIADPHEKLYKMLIGCSDRNLTDWHMASHTSLLKQSLKQQKGTASAKIFDNNVREVWLQNNLMYTMDCRCTKRPAENVKWYQFLGIDYALYIFLKLEDHPTINAQHIGQAISRYIFNQPNESCKMPRREDCKKCDPSDLPKNGKDKECCGEFVNYQYTSFIIKDDNKLSGKNTSANTGVITENYGRVGDEVYVPAQISDYMLESHKFDHYAKDLTMTETPPDTIVIGETRSTRVGGTRRRCRVTRRRRRRITRRITRRKS